MPALKGFRVDLEVCVFTWTTSHLSVYFHLLNILTGNGERVDRLTAE